MQVNFLHLNEVYDMKNYDLRSINLSLSSACNADCIFCPEERGERIKVKMMSPQLVEKVVSEVATDPELKTVVNFNCGENGEVFLNPQSINCLRIIKNKLPHCKIALNTNFSLFTKEKISTVLEEGLIDRIGCNIDGHDDYHYRSVKRLDFDTTFQNITDFLKIRHTLNSKVPLTIFSITYATYVTAIKRNLGVSPIKLGNSEVKIKDDFKEIRKTLKPLLVPKMDKLVHARFVEGWAERGQINVTKLNYNKYCCPLIDRVKHEAWIAPDGTWYACCRDSKNELVIGNVATSTIGLLAKSKMRKELITALEDKRFVGIGGPCSTVICCQALYKSKILIVLSSIFKTDARLIKLARAVKIMN